eukprot:1737100-Amphidinium_carterae.1
MAWSFSCMIGDLARCKSEFVLGHCLAHHNTACGVLAVHAGAREDPSHRLQPLPRALELRGLFARSINFLQQPYLHSHARIQALGCNSIAIVTLASNIVAYLVEGAS